MNVGGGLVVVVGFTPSVRRGYIIFPAKVFTYFGLLAEREGDVDARMDTDLPTVNRGMIDFTFPLFAGLSPYRTARTHMLSARDLTPQT